MSKTPDPTKDPEFQKVVQVFLRTKPKPRKKGSKKVQPKQKRKAEAPRP